MDANQEFLPDQTDLRRARRLTEARLQRSNGAVAVAFASDGTLESLFQSDPCRFFLPPPPRGDLPQGLFLTTSGGIAAGDKLDLRFTWRKEARASVTSGAAEKIYRRGGGASAEIATSLSVGAGAYAEFLPQETILFRDAGLKRQCRVDLAADATLLASDMVVLGRAASGERFDQGRLLDRWAIYRDGQLVHFDALALDAANGALADQAGFDGAGAFGFALLAGPAAPSLLDKAREILANSTLLCGATLVHDILLLRWLAAGGEELRQAVGAVVGGLRGRLGLPAHPPSLWH
jgi:urease accessory protein